MVNDLLLSNRSLEFGTLPLFLQTPIYGKLNPSFADFVAPGCIVSFLLFESLGMLASLMFASAIGLACLNFVIDRKEG